MRVIADANVLFSCLLREGLTRRVWFNPELEICAPAFIFAELSKHKQELLEKYGGTGEQFEAFFSTAFKNIKLIPDDELKPYLPAAASLTADPNDWLYLACALKENASIWTHDKGFIGQSRVKAATTAELAGEIGML